MLKKKFLYLTILVTILSIFCFSFLKSKKDNKTFHHGLEITLQEETMTLCPKFKNIYENYFHDKLMRKKIRFKERNYQLYSDYEVKIIFEDNESPEITLKGDTEYSIFLGDVYEEPGYEVFDKCDGNLYDQVTVTGTIDTSQKGTYELVYHVFDKSGNEAQEKRIVKVINRPSSDKIIYLTFDDGPSSTITPALLDVLKEEGVKATFFVLNRGDELNYLIQREHAEGHTVALHGSSHNYRQIYSSPSAFFGDLYIIQNKVKEITGVSSTIIRFPGGSSNTVSRFNPGIMTTLAKEVNTKGFHYFDWNVDSEDAGRARSEEDVYRNVTSHLNYQHNVVLMHDFSGNYKTLNAIRRIIQYGKQNGYTFENISMDTPEIHHGINN